MYSRIVHSYNGSEWEGHGNSNIHTQEASKM